MWDFANQMSGASLRCSPGNIRVHGNWTGSSRQWSYRYYPIPEPNKWGFGTAQPGTDGSMCRHSKTEGDLTPITLESEGSYVGRWLDSP